MMEMLFYLSPLESITSQGQIVMEGFLELRIRPWLRQLITRSLAIIPAAIAILILGDGSSYKLLIWTQVLLVQKLHAQIHNWGRGGLYTCEYISLHIRLLLITAHFLQLSPPPLPWGKKGICKIRTHNTHTSVVQVIKTE